MRDRQGPDERDAPWSHPDLMPQAADLDDPLGFAQGKNRTESDDAFDAALGELLDAPRDDPRPDPQSEDE